MKGKVIILNAPPNAGKDTIAASISEITGAEHREFKDELYRCTAEYFKLELEWYIGVASDRATKDDPCWNISLPRKEYFKLLDAKGTAFDSEDRLINEGWEDVRPKAAVAANVGTGPDIILSTNDDANLYPDKLVDVSDVCNYLGKKYDGWYPVCEQYLKPAGKWIGVPLGVWAAVRQGRMVDHVIRIIGLFGYSVPIFWLGMVALVIFYAKLDWLPGPGRIEVYYDGMVEPVTGVILIDSAMQGEWEIFENALRHLVNPATPLS